MDNFYAFYDPETGKIVSRTTLFPLPGPISMTLDEVADFEAGELGLLAVQSDISFPLQSTYIDLATKEHRPIPVKPGKDHKWNWGAKQWVDDRSLLELKQALAAAVTAKRWQVENGGLTLPNGIRVKTEAKDQDRITSVIVNAQLAGITEINFKAESGWVTLQITDLISIAQFIAFHVQACFTAERSHHEAILALENEISVRNYDISVGWPN